MAGPESVVVVGASLAGFNAARALRREGYDGSVTLIGAEPHRVYDRPPLSKQFLAGKVDRSGLTVPGADKEDELDLTWLTGVAATGLDLDARRVQLADGESVPFGGLVIATGGDARHLPGTEGLRGVHVVRTVDDSEALRADLEQAPERVVVVGAGFIGAEVASTCRERGIAVTMIEAADVPMERAIGAEMGRVCAAIQTDNGVDLRLGVGVSGLEETGAGDDRRVTGVRLDDGSTVEADVVVVGIGVVPATGWLEGSGLTLDNGVVCDATCLAAPGVVAAGDVARWPNHAFGGEVMRVEHWENAVDQGGHAGARLLRSDAEAEPFTPVPWFWSDQYEYKIQLAGRVRSTDDVAIIDGSVEERRFAALFGRDGRVAGVFGMNRPRQVIQYRMKLADGVDWAEALAEHEAG